MFSSKSQLGLLAMTFVGALFIASLVVAQQGQPESEQPPAPAPGEQPPVEQSQPAEDVAPADGQQARTYRAKEVLGAKVTLEGETAAGTVDDIVFDDYGAINYLIVINSDRRLVTIPWEAAKFNVEKRTAVVHIAPDRFQEVPTYTPQQYPVYSEPAYRTRVFKFFGLKPQVRESRRIEREDRDD
jgi:hypothetical protein